MDDTVKINITDYSQSQHILTHSAFKKANSTSVLHSTLQNRPASTSTDVYDLCRRNISPPLKRNVHKKYADWLQISEWELLLEDPGPVKEEVGGGDVDRVQVGGREAERVWLPLLLHLFFLSAGLLLHILHESSSGKASWPESGSSPWNRWQLVSDIYSLSLRNNYFLSAHSGAMVWSFPADIRACIYSKTST